MLKRRSLYKNIGKKTNLEFIYILFTKQYFIAEQIIFKKIVK